MRLLLRACALLSAISAAVPPPLAAREFTVAVYNVENLFDADGVSLFDEYQTTNYTTAHLARKLENVSATLQRFNNGAGPDIVILNELEGDQTPDGGAADLAGFVASWRGKSPGELLREATQLEGPAAGLPSYVWLLLQLKHDGLPPYRAAVAEYRPPARRGDASTEHVIAHVNVILTRFPIIEQRTHPTPEARGILEVVLEVDGHRLHVFNNHWKSGASDPTSEPDRMANAETLRRRLDEILRADPHADVILGGDFNSQYNQKQRYRAMPRTGINDVLRSQGDELALQRRSSGDGESAGADLYNLWFELPPDQRGSDIYSGEWGTLMHLLVTPGLYDFRGVQYVDNSFTVAAFPGFNVERETGRPVRWQFTNGGAGFSDHLPIVAKFRTVADDATDRWLALQNPSRTREGPSEAVPVKLPLETATELASWPKEREFRTPENLGRFFKVAGKVTNERPFRVWVDGATGGEIAVWIFDPAARTEFFGRHKVGDRISFVGELGQYRGEWQFVIPASAVR